MKRGTTLLSLVIFLIGLVFSPQRKAFKAGHFHEINIKRGGQEERGHMMEDNYNWFIKHKFEPKFYGLWIAISKRHIIAKAKSSQELMTQIKVPLDKVLITRIPPRTLCNNSLKF